MLKFSPTKIADVLIVEPQVFEDARGYFFESYSEADFAKNGLSIRFVQDNQSKSSYGVIRGLHCQLGEHAQVKLVRALAGKILDVAVDARKDSPTFGQFVAVELSAENRRQLLIPRGFLHGFSVLSDEAIVAYKCDQLYCKESEFGIRYDDPEIGIDWRVPREHVITSEKDRLANTLKDLCARAAQMVQK